jgi:uncharacterized protein (TIGR02001 family)
VSKKTTTQRKELNKMKKLTQAVAAASLISAGLMGAQVAQAEVSFNVAATSNYVWRGATQSADASALQGGIDYSNEAGFALGAWQSSIENDTETDYYGSYTFSLSDSVSLDAGFIDYDYSNDDTLDFVELYAGATVGPVSATYYQKVSDGDDNKDNDDDGYASVSYGFDLVESVSASLTAGKIITDVKGADLWDVAFAVTKSTPEFDFTATITDKKESDEEFFITVSKGF